MLIMHFVVYRIWVHIFGHQVSLIWLIMLHGVPFIMVCLWGQPVLCGHGTESAQCSRFLHASCSIHVSSAKYHYSSADRRIHSVLGRMAEWSVP